MKRTFLRNAILPAITVVLFACNNATNKIEPEAKTPQLKEETVSYAGDGITMNSFVVYDENKTGARPAVLVIPEWWGLNDYARKRARELADLGYIAMAVDLYGDGKVADNPDSAGAYAKPFYSNPQMTKARFDAGLAKIKSYAQTDTSRIGAIGYCFGGAQVLNLARMGEDLKGVVSFHGNLLGVPLDKSKLKAEILVCHGAADPYVPMTEADQFRREMDSAGVHYTFKAYDGAMHAFTNPDATALGKRFNMSVAYNAAADTASWNEMKGFFERVLK